MHRRQAYGQLPAVAVAVKVEQVAGNAYILAQADAGEPVPGIGTRKIAVRPSTQAPATGTTPGSPITRTWCLVRDGRMTIPRAAAGTLEAIEPTQERGRDGDLRRSR